MTEKTAQEFIADKVAAQKELDQLQQRNMSKVQALAGFGKSIDAGVLANIKIDTFLETFLDEGAKMVYLRNLEVKLGAMLDEALAQVRQEALTQGAPAKTLFIPKG